MIAANFQQNIQINLLFYLYNREEFLLHFKNSLNLTLLYKSLIKLVGNPSYGRTDLRFFLQIHITVPTPPVYWITTYMYNAMCLLSAADTTRET